MPQVGQPEVAQFGVHRGWQVGCGGGAAGLSHPGMYPEAHRLAGVGVGVGAHQCLLHQRDQGEVQVGRVTGAVQALPQVRPDGLDDLVFAVVFFQAAQESEQGGRVLSNAWNVTLHSSGGAPRRHGRVTNGAG